MCLNNLFKPTGLDIDWCRLIKNKAEIEGHNILSNLSPDELATYYIFTNSAIRESGAPNFKVCKFPVPTHWDLDAWEDALQDYHDNEILQFFRYGWPIDLMHIPESVPIPSNQQGAFINKEKIDAYIETEIDQRSVIGPFTDCVFEGARCSPIDALAKKNSNDIRVILNLSHPDESRSVNAAVDKNVYLGRETNLCYPTMDSLVELILSTGPGCAIMKTDLRKYYRQIYIDPGSVHLLGFRIDKSLYFDITLSMGLRIACYIAQRISSAIMFIYRKRGFLGVNYLDDLASVSAWSSAFVAFENLYNLLQELGVWESHRKRCAPDISMEFLGITANTVKLMLYLTDSRLAELKAECKRWGNKESATKRELQQLIGKLNFASSTVRSGRLFFSRILAFMTSIPTSDKLAHPIPDDTKKDISWWTTFIDQYNGVSMMHELTWRECDSVISSDACLGGLGGFCSGEYFHCEVPASIKKQEDVFINELECLAIVLSLRIWGQKCAGCNIFMYCDNLNTVTAINKGRASNKFSQKCLREIAYLAAQGSFQIKVIHCSGVSNRIPDYLSRWHQGSEFKEKFFKEALLSYSPGQLKQVLIAESLFKFSHDW